MQIKTVLYVERDGEEVEVEISGYFQRQSRGGRDDPGEAAHVALEASSIPLTPEEAERAEEKLWERVAYLRDCEEARREDFWEAERERWAERARGY